MMIEILHGLGYQSLSNYDSIVSISSCKILTFFSINSLRSVPAVHPRSSFTTWTSACPEGTRSSHAVLRSDRLAPVFTKACGNIHEPAIFISSVLEESEMAPYLSKYPLQWRSHRHEYQAHLDEASAGCYSYLFSDPSIGSFGCF